MKKKQKTVWITGASSGIGLAFAKAYAKKGYRLILTARRQGRLEKLADNLGVPCRIETADLFKEKECYRVCEILKEETIDIFINNAGFGNCGDFARTDLSKDMDMIRVNVEAMHILCKEVLRQMAGADRVVAFGDNHNDLAMAGEADVFCAVANATADVLNCADQVIPANTEDGVIRYLLDLESKGGW